MSNDSTSSEAFLAILPDKQAAQGGQAALIVIDLTNFDAHPDHGLARIFAENGDDMTYFWDRLANVTVPNATRLVGAFRSWGRVMYTRVGAQFDDYADSLGHVRDLHRRAGTLRGTAEFDLRDEFVPRVGEAVVDKSGASVFTTSNADTLLRNAGVRHVVFCGVLTNVCVLLSAMTAWDLGYDVTIVSDACAADSQEIHESALQIARWLGCRVVDTDELVGEITEPTTGDKRPDHSRELV